jgi:sterol desaturase/sphingolipid hydroxylase (fatty acid hydroxylase superfamily)
MFSYQVTIHFIFMEQIIFYFENIPSSHRTALLVGGIAFFWILESTIPLFKIPYKKLKHAGTNIFFTITTIVVNFTMAFLLVRSADWAQAMKFGILNCIPDISLWLYTLIGLLLMDLIGAYLVHWTQHKVKWMWRFHLIHHTDTHVDTTSANRHHPGESVFRFVFTTLGVVITGAPMWLVMMYQSFSVILSQFNHANIALPKKMDSWLSWFLVTPDMHHVHHHYVLPYTDSNYGNIFSIWDRLFGTFKTMDRTELVYGLDTYPDAKENAEILPLLKIPFQSYRLPVGAKLQETQLEDE